MLGAACCALRAVRCVPRVAAMLCALVGLHTLLLTQLFLSLASFILAGGERFWCAFSLYLVSLHNKENEADKQKCVKNE